MKGAGRSDAVVGQLVGCCAYVATDNRTAVRKTAQSAPAPQKEMKQPEFPEGWDEERVRRVLEHFEIQLDEEAVTEDEAAYESTHTAMEILAELVPQVRELLAKKRAE
jgi:hypothetical protein